MFFKKKPMQEINMNNPSIVQPLPQGLKHVEVGQIYNTDNVEQIKNSNNTYLRTEKEKEMYEEFLDYKDKCEAPLNQKLIITITLEVNKMKELLDVLAITNQWKDTYGNEPEIKISDSLPDELVIKQKQNE